MRGKFTTGVAMTALLITGLGAPAWADDDGPVEAAALIDTSVSGMTVYAAAWFSTFTPRTARDMVAQVPGFQLSSGDTQRRGLGDSFGNLLINGERPANKSLSPETVLQRIPAGDVLRVELIQEALPQYEMRGHPRLVNVIVREGTGNSGTYSVSLRQPSGTRVGGGGEVSYTFQAGEAEITVGLEGTVWTPTIRRREALLDGNGDLIETRIDSDQRLFNEYIPSLSLTLPLGERTTLRADARAFLWTWSRDEISTITAAGSTAPTRFETQSTDDENNTPWTSTFTLEHEFENGLSAETILLYSRRAWHEGPGDFTTLDANGQFVDAVIFESETENQEMALRETFSYTINAEHDVEFGAEGAFNSRDTGFTLDFDDGTSVTPIELPVSNTTVEETRGEIFGTHTWTMSDTMTLESGLRWEFSEIAQDSFDATGAVIFSQARTFNYPKPSFTLNWNPEGDDQWRVSARRDVAQLDFGRFASSVNLSDNDNVIGNPDYVPERTWTLEGEWRRQIGEDNTISLKVGNDWIEDKDDFIVIDVPNDNGTPGDPSDDFVESFTAPGNIGDASIFRITWESSSNLDFLGIPNARLDTFLEWYDTEVDDPVTGEARNLSGFREWEARLDFRQDFPEQQWAWGWDYFWLSDGEVFRFNEKRNMGFTDGDLDIFIETTRFMGVTLRASVDGVIDNGEDRERIFFDGSRANGIITGREFQNTQRGTVFALNVRGTF
jgi:hypothetical protein